MKYFISILIIIISISCNKQKKVEKFDIFKLEFFNMDTDLSIKYVAKKRNIKLEREIKEYINQFDKENSFYKKESYLSKLNNLNDNQSLKVAHSFCKLLELSANYQKTTENRFNIAYKSPQMFRNFNNLQINCKKDIIRVIKKGTILDTGGIAKGYSIDKTADILKRYNYKNFIVNYGGDILICGKKPNNKNWSIGIKDPFSKSKLLKIITKNTNNCYSVATSGDYRRYVIKNGKKYSHIIDPKTGLSVEDAHSVTVISNNATKSDVLATAISVANKDIAYIKRMKKKFNLKIYMLIGNNRRLLEY